MPACALINIAAWSTVSSDYYAPRLVLKWIGTMTRGMAKRATDYRSHRTYVAVQSGRVIGYAIVKQLRGMAEFRAIYVHPLHMGKGVGSKLLAVALRGVRGKVIVHASINPASVRFYKKHGFVIKKRMLWYGFPIVLMERT
jgi:GNAT superfamily N-acetyltransferase